MPSSSSLATTGHMSRFKAIVTGKHTTDGQTYFCRIIRSEQLLHDLYSIIVIIIRRTWIQPVLVPDRREGTSRMSAQLEHAQDCLCLLLIKTCTREA